MKKENVINTLLINCGRVNAEVAVVIVRVVNARLLTEWKKWSSDQ